MNRVIYNLTLDLTKGASQHVVVLKQGDVDTREIVVRLRSGGVPYDVVEGATALLYAKGVGEYLVDCKVSGDTVSCVLPSSIIDQPSCIAEIRITDDTDAVLSSPSFMIISEEAVFSDDAVTGTNDFSALLNAIRRAEESRIATASVVDGELILTYGDGTVANVGNVKGAPFKYEDFTPEQLAELKGEQGERGISGVYVGSGEMPEGYNVQIDPEGDTDLSGLTKDEKSLILTLFKNVSMYDADMSIALSVLEARWLGESSLNFAVTASLDHSTIDNDASSVPGGLPYTATITADEGNFIYSVTVMMGGRDVTDSVYSDGVISITSVTGDVIITVDTMGEADLAPAYELSAPLTFADTDANYGTVEGIYDTGYSLYTDGSDRDYTICLAFSGIVGYGSVLQNMRTLKYTGINIGRASYFWNAVIYGGGQGKLSGDPFNGKVFGTLNNCKIVITHKAGSADTTIRYVADEFETTTFTMTGYGSSVAASTNTFLLNGYYCTNDTQCALFKGTIDACKIYERVIEENEVTAFMGV